jgi:hypothetical protein
MSQTDQGRTRSEFANTREVNETDAALLESVTGRQDHLGMTEATRVAAGDIKKPIGAQPRSDVTNVHDDGVGARETADGLDLTGEATRQAAEDVPAESPGDIPVFDRGGMLPKV